MIEPFHAWKEFWDREISALCNTLPRDLVGGAPVSIYLYQPSAPGRLVYLNLTAGSPDPILMPFGPNAHKLFFDTDPTSNWRSRDPIADLKAVEDFLKLELKDRRRFYEAETGRYSKGLYDRDAFHVKLGEKYCIKLICPSPLYHHKGSWWQRLPRLGVCYTIADELATVDPSLSKGDPATSDRLLLVCSIAGGNRILSKRLRLIFNNTFQWPNKGKRVPFSAENIARRICSSHSSQGNQYEWDQQIYLITRLIIAHHILFPSDASALQLFRELGLDANSDVLLPHGWDPAAEPTQTEIKFQVCFNNLVADLMFLLYALMRWEHPDDSQPRLAEEAVEDIVRDLALTSLSLLCARVDARWSTQFIDKEKARDFTSLRPPPLLLSLGSVRVPGMPIETIARALGDKLDWHEYFLYTLSPLGSKTRAKNLKSVEAREIEFANGEIKVSSKTSDLPWAAAYLRARFRAAPNPQQPNQAAPATTASLEAVKESQESQPPLTARD